MICCIVLAAGESRRMGRPKQLLPFGGGTVLRAVVGNALAAGIGPVLVVLGHRAEDVAASLEGLAEPCVAGWWGGEAVADPDHDLTTSPPHDPQPARWILNPDYASGMLSSVQAGVRAALPLLPGDGRDGFLFCLGDQPQVKPATYRRVAEAFTGSATGIVLPTRAGRRGHPAAYSSAYAGEMLAIGPESSLREILSRHPDDVAEVPVDDRGVLEDLDTPEDYERLGSDQRP